MEELNSIELLYPEWIAKNLFVCDDKKRNYYLITVKGDKQYGLRALSFAASDDLMNLIQKHGNEAEYVEISG